MENQTDTLDARITAIYAYPVKGLSPRAMARVALSAGETLPGDRAYAIEAGGREFDEQNPAFLPKNKFLMLMRDERLAALATHYDGDTGMLTVSRAGKQVARGNLDEPLGRQVLEQFFAAFMGKDLRGSPRIVHAPGHSISDVAAKVVSIINLASVRDLERVTGRPIDPLRFRANIYIDSIAAWSEFDWVGRTLAAGASARLEGFSRIRRCAATNVNPATAQRDMQIPRTLLGAYGHGDCGIYANVTAPGTIAPGDALRPV